jgi:hypothetical protein
MLLMGLSDIIDDTDPCTLNPSDPVCQGFGPGVAKDPCQLDPTQPFCQQAIVSQFPDPRTPTLPPLPIGTNDPMVMPSLPTASLALLTFPWKFMFGLAAVSVIGYVGYRHFTKRRKAA